LRITGLERPPFWRAAVWLLKYIRGLSASASNDDDY